MKNLFNRFVREDAGQDLIEYALLLGLIAVGTIGIVGGIGTKVLNIFTNMDTQLGAAPGAGGAAGS